MARNLTSMLTKTSSKLTARVTIGIASLVEGLAPGTSEALKQFHLSLQCWQLSFGCIDPMDRISATDRQGLGIVKPCGKRA